MLLRLQCSCGGDYYYYNPGKGKKLETDAAQLYVSVRRQIHLTKQMNGANLYVRAQIR